MRWKSARRRKTGGYHVCVVKVRLADARYNTTDAGRARHRRYDHSEKGRARIARVEAGPVRRLSKRFWEMARTRVRY